MHTQNWVVDYRGPNRATMYRVERTIASTTSPYQEILIVDTQDYGRALFLDGLPQSAAVDEAIYHEALVHPALLAHPAPRTVFIAGGGEGAVVREALKHPTVERVVMVDIDGELVDLARRHLGAWHQGALDDPRVEVVHADARQYLADRGEVYDCVVLDLSDPLESSPSALLFTLEFFELAKARLDGGTLAVQAETTDGNAYNGFVSIVKTLRVCFETVLPYQTTIPFFGSGWGFVLAGDRVDERFGEPAGIDEELARRGCSGLVFYDGETHRHLFSLPKHLRRALDDAHVGMVIRENQRLVVE